MIVAAWPQARLFEGFRGPFRPCGASEAQHVVCVGAHGGEDVGADADSAVEPHGVATRRAVEAYPIASGTVKGRAQFRMVWQEREAALP